LRCGHCGAGMAQASGKSGRYRYYKCTTKLNKNVAGCHSRNLPREVTDRLVLSVLSDRIFTPPRVTMFETTPLNQLLTLAPPSTISSDFPNQLNLFGS
ncbi:MAG: zinc ribbon domain-containing protein, partial [Dongiaceae bacterium]